MTSTRPEHPGTISFYEVVDGTTRLVEEIDATDLPDPVRFAHDADGRPTPVVTVVEIIHGARGSLREFGPEGVFLRTTTMLRTPPAGT